METNQLKFLLKLLGYANYRSALKNFDSFKQEKSKICRNLGDRGLIDFSREITSIKLLPPGRALLKMEKEKLPLSSDEVQVLQALGQSSGKIKPSQIKKIKAVERDPILQSFHERGLIEVETSIKRLGAEVWLTERGLEYLRNEFVPKKGVQPAITLDQLSNYLRFLRKTLQNQAEASSHSSSLGLSLPSTESKPTDEEVLQIIKDLDYNLGTDNYLPIFHLRQKLQPPLSREELDQALYRLENNDRIELSALVEARFYTQEQISAGIKQRSGSPLFFIRVTTD